MEARLENNLRIALYTRVSTEEQREGQTIDSQISELERFVRDRGWTLVRTYRDEGWSGAMLARPALDALRDDASKGLYDGVLVNDVDRLARDVAHLGIIKRDLERRGVRVIFRKLPSDNTPTYNLLVNVLGSFAEFEREMIADRMRRGRRHKIEVRKEFHAGRVPYGYRYVHMDRVSGTPGRLEVEPEQASIVRQMFRWVDEDGFSAHEVVRRLNALGSRPPRSTVWHLPTVLNILHRETYTGIWYHYRYESCEPKRDSPGRGYRKRLKSAHRRRPRTDWIPFPLPASHILAPQDQWDRVQQQLKRNLKLSKRNSHHNYLLRGLVRCGGCSRTMVGDPCHGLFVYRCPKRCKETPSVSESKLNTAVWTALVDALRAPAVVAEQVTTWLRTRAATSLAAGAAIMNAQTALSALDREEQRVLDAYRQEVISTEQLRTELARIKTRRSLLLEQASGQGATDSSADAVERTVADWCGIVAQRLAATSPDDRQRLVQWLIREVWFDGSSVRITANLQEPPRDSSPTLSIPEAPHGPAAPRGVTNAQSGGIATTSMMESIRNSGTGDAVVGRDDHDLNDVPFFEITCSVNQSDAPNRVDVPDACP